MSQIKLSHLSVAKVSGEDAEDYLQGQLTADLTALTDGDACFSAYCRPSGNVLAVILVLKHKEDFYLVASQDLMSELLGELGRFILRARVTMEPSNKCVAGLSSGNMPQGQSSWSPKGTNLIFGLIENSGHEDKSELQDWRRNELNSGIVWLDRQTSDQYLPQMLGLENIQALSFRKGCFPGQEVIARVRYLGKLKRRPLMIQIKNPTKLAIGEQIHMIAEDGKAHLGSVVDFAGTAEDTIVFIVVRAPENVRFNEMETGGVRMPLLLPVQT